jgi:hypothetical protein
LSYWLWRCGVAFVTLWGMSAQVTIHSSAPVRFEVAASLLTPLRETLLQLYGVSAETLHWTQQALEDGRAELSELLEARERLSQLGDTLDQIGWCGEERSAVREISAPTDVLLDATLGALIDAQERLATRWSAADYRAHTSEGAYTLTREVSELQQLLSRIKAGRAIGELCAALRFA